MSMYNLIEYRGNDSKTPGSLWQYYKVGPKNSITNSVSFRFKSRFLGSTNNDGIINAEVAAPLKYLSNFWGTIEVTLNNFEINLILTWSKICVISEGGPLK